MEHKFGIFNTVEELNRAAAAQKAEGDIEALKGLAAENGIEEADVEDYLDDLVEELTTPCIAAMAKLSLEERELDLKSQLKDWKDYVVYLCTEDEKLCHAVFSPDKQLLNVLAAGLKLASKNRITVDRKIIKAAGLPDSAAYIGMCGRDDLRRITYEYYLGGES